MLSDTPACLFRREAAHRNTSDGETVLDAHWSLIRPGTLGRPHRSTIKVDSVSSMIRNKALTELTPGQRLRMSDKQLGAFFCGELFAFILVDRTRRAAERLARLHGCTFQFDATTGCGAFVKRHWTSGLLASLVESAIQWLGKFRPESLFAPPSANAARTTPGGLRNH